MPKIINTDEQLRSLIPNQILSVKGESSIFDKLITFLCVAEDWVSNTFTSETVFDRICSYQQSNAISQITSRLVVADAMRRASPSLDVVLTPNGFATVGTQNLVAASKMRVDRLVESMMSHRDDCIAALLTMLPSEPDWIDSKQAEFFGATLFNDLSIVDAVSKSDGNKWDRYVNLRAQVIDLEASLAEDWLSQELLAALREDNLRGTLSGKRKEVVKQVKAQVIGYLRSGAFSSRRLADIVNFIRLNPESFNEWHSSSTAQMFAPPVFRNDRKASGYFF